jgi:hypothetical protein
LLHPVAQQGSNKAPFALHPLTAHRIFDPYPPPRGASGAVGTIEAVVVVLPFENIARWRQTYFYFFC